MASVTAFSNKRILIIDDIKEVRTQLQLTVSMIGFERLQHVATIKDAMEKISSMDYDVILCDYNLGKGTNGQQFLEYLRINEKLSRSSIFVMVTAENSYEKVIATAEYMPDDYLLKPFTAAHFLSRLEALLDRQEMLKAINQAYDKRAWALAIEESDKLLMEKNKHYIEICKVKASTFMQAEMFNEAAEVYNHVISIRDLPWANLGLARAKAHLGWIDESQAIVSRLIDENPQFLVSLDFASDLLMQQDKPDEAMNVLRNAMQKSPDNLNRSRSYVGIALSKGEYEEAERVIKDAVKRHRYSPVREASDYGMLSRAILEQGRAQEALNVLDEAKEVFKDEASTTILSASSSIAWLRYGDEDRASVELEQALAKDYKNLPPNVATSLAEACYEAGKNEQGDNLLRHVLQNHPDDLKLQSRVKMVQALSGKTLDESNALIQDSAREVIKINNEGVLKAKEGRYEEAVALILGAADRLPNNANIISNAALILAVSLTKMAFNRDWYKKCLMYRQRVIDMNPNHKKLAQINATLANVKVEES